MNSLKNFLIPVDSIVYKKYQDYFDSIRDLLIFSDGVIIELKKKKLQREEISDYKKYISYCFVSAPCPHVAD